jgi:alkaline phosphatase D
MDSQPPPAKAWIDRRRFLTGVAGVAGAAALAKLPVGRATAAPRPAGGEYPFKLGVASGDPAATGVVLWTRLAPQPFEAGGGMPARRVTVQWQLAGDKRFRQVVRHGTAWALPQLGHSVHVEVGGLRPDREWFYRFRYRNEVSPAGRTRTAVPAGVAGSTLAFASCQAWDSGYYPSYRHMAQEDLDLVLHLGDYVYEGGIAADGGYRRTPTPEVLRDAPRDLERWRMQYALYKSDPDLQAAHARFPWMVTWDDHEVQNDYANTQSQYEGDISALRAAAYQAWYEHQPVRAPARPDADGPRVYRRLRWGNLVQLDVVDGRQDRSVPPCGWGEADACEQAYDPSVTMLGAEQERWLYDGLASSPARWNILGSNVMLPRLDHDGAAGDRLWHDAWDGLLRPDDQVQPAHQVLRRRPSWLRAVQGRALPDAGGPAGRQHGEPPRRPGVDLCLVRHRERPAGSPARLGGLRAVSRAGSASDAVWQHDE